MSFNSGEVLLKMGRVDQARIRLEDALGLADSAEHPQARSAARISLAELECEVGNLERADTLLRQAEQLLAGTSDSLLYGAALCVRAAWLARSERIEEAREKLADARQVAERTGATRDSELGKRLENLEARLGG